MTTPATTKPWYLSKTIWFNFLCAMTFAAEASLGIIKDALPGGLYPWLAFALIMGNTALRFITQQQVALLKADAVATSTGGAS
jgi:hypothetical protein